MSELGLPSFKSSPEYAHTFAGRPRIESLTGLRWFAALAVFFSHFPLPGMPTWVENIFANGYMGVTVFFVLSGFILTVSYGSKLSNRSLAAVWDFGVARIARVYPTYLLVLLYVVVLGLDTGGNLHHVLLHIFAVQTWGGNAFTAFKFNGPGWSVGVEFFLYLCFPLLIFVLGPALESSWVDCLVVAATVVIGLSAAVLVVHIKGLDALPYYDANSSHRWLYRNPAVRLGDFVLGICAAYLYLNRRVKPPRVWVTVCSETVLVLVILGLMSQKSIYFSAGSWDVIYAVPTAILLWFLAVRPHTGLARILAVPLIVALGEASYAFYLIHYPIKLQLIEFSATGGTLDNVLLDLLQLGLITALAWGVHVSFERPARRLVRNTLSRNTQPRRDPLAQ